MEREYRRRDPDISEEKDFWSAAEDASDCHRTVESYHWSDKIIRTMNAVKRIVFMVFLCYKPFGWTLSCLQKKGELFVMDYVPAMYATFWALIPPVVAIVLALITKEVYSSLFLGILVGGLFYSGFSFEGTIVHIFEDGIIVSMLSDSYNVGILDVPGYSGSHCMSYEQGWRISCIWPLGQ